MPREVPMCQLVLSQVGIVRFVEGFVSIIENYSNSHKPTVWESKMEIHFPFNQASLSCFCFFFNFVLLNTEILDINFSHFLKSFSWVPKHFIANSHEKVSFSVVFCVYSEGKKKSLKNSG